MVRKISTILSVLVICCALCTTAQAYSHTVYENGTMSTTYLTYFKDILTGVDISENYVAFRSGQNAYTMVVGDLKFENGVISLETDEKGKEYTFSTENSSYNSQYKYEVNEIYFFDVETGNNIIYSDVGDFPQLIERGSYFEIIQTLLLSVALLSVVISRIFYKRAR